MNKNLLTKIGRTVICASFLALVNQQLHAQTNGDFRTRINYNASYTSTSGWQVFNSATGWTDTPLLPATGSTATIRDGVVMTSNGNITAASILNVGEGNAANITATIDGSGIVTGLTIVSAGRLSSKPNPSTTLHSGLVFVGGATVGAAAVITSYTISGTAINFGGSAYTAANTTITFAAPVLIAGQTASSSALITATGQAIISGGVITGINITNAGSGYTNIPAITITGDGTSANFSAQLGVQEISITTPGSGYTVSPTVIAGSSFQVGGSSSRTVIIENQLNFRAGARSVTNNSAAVNQTLILGGDLTVVTPINFRSVFQTFTGNTNVTFNKNRSSGEASINGGNITFNNLTLSATTTVNNYATITVLGTTNLNGTGVLPVGLTSFTAKNETDKIRVSWTTSSESDNDKFEVLKSTDGVNFIKTATIKAKGPSTYTIDDYYPFKGTNYYKLLQYDLNGTVNDEGVRFANFSFNTNDVSSSVYPNPLKSSNPIFVKFKQGLGNSKLTMFASDGKIIHEESVDNPGYAGYELKLKKELKPGLYLLNINSTSINERLKVIVQ